MLTYQRHIPTQTAKSAKVQKLFTNKPNPITDTGCKSFEFGFVKSDQEIKVCIRAQEVFDDFNQLFFGHVRHWGAR